MCGNLQIDLATVQGSLEASQILGLQHELY